MYRLRHYFGCWSILKSASGLETVRNSTPITKQTIAVPISIVIFSPSCLRGSYAGQLLSAHSGLHSQLQFEYEVLSLALLVNIDRVLGQKDGQFRPLFLVAVHSATPGYTSLQPLMSGIATSKDSCRAECRGRIQRNTPCLNSRRMVRRFSRITRSHDHFVSMGK